MAMIDTGTLLLQMQRDGAMTDYTFVIQGTEVKVHQIVVCGRGGRLKEIIEENPDGVKIDEITHKTFSTILE